MTTAHFVTAALWCLVFVALFGAVLVVIRILEGKPRNNVREMPHEDCWAACSHPLHYTPHIPSPADAWSQQ